MKRILWMYFVIMSLPVFLTAYEVKGKAQATFGTAQTASQEGNVSTEKSVSPTKSFTSYGARRNWSQGVQTQTVKTNQAGEGVSQFQSVPTEVQAESVVSKAVNLQPKPGAAEKPVPTQASTQTVSGAGDMAQTAAAMQQLQSMQNMVQNMGALTGETEKQSSGNNTPKGGKPATPPQGQAGLMPDFSAILNAAGAVPADRK